MAPGADRAAGLQVDRRRPPSRRRRRALPSGAVARGKRSLVRIAPGPMKTPSVHGHAVVDERAALDLHPVADGDALVDEDAAADDALGADAGPRSGPGPGARCSCPAPTVTSSSRSARRVDARRGIDHGRVGSWTSIGMGGRKYTGRCGGWGQHRRSDAEPAQRRRSRAQNSPKAAPKARPPRQSRTALTGPSTRPATSRKTPVVRWTVALPVISVPTRPCSTRRLAGDDAAGRTPG